MLTTLISELKIKNNLMIFSKQDVLNNKVPNHKLGIYYFIDGDDKILYIGKSKNIKIRLQQHLKNGRKRLIQKFSKVKLKVMNTELEALLLESQKIKQHLPVFNRRLRKTKSLVGIYQESNNSGYKHYSIKNKTKGSILEFKSKTQALNFLGKITEKFNLCPKLNGLDNSSSFCFQFHLKACNGACNQMEEPSTYNLRFKKSISSITKIPRNCRLIFNESNFSTFVNIKNKTVKSFGVTNQSFFEVNYPSNDDIRIVSMYHKITTPKMILT